MVCKHCGNEIKDNSTFCDFCLEPVDSSENSNAFIHTFFRALFIVVAIVILIGIIIFFVYNISYIINGPVSNTEVSSIESADSILDTASGSPVIDFNTLTYSSVYEMQDVVLTPQYKSRLTDFIQSYAISNYVYANSSDPYAIYCSYISLYLNSSSNTLESVGPSEYSIPDLEELLLCYNQDFYMDTFEDYLNNKASNELIILSPDNNATVLEPSHEDLVNNIIIEKINTVSSDPMIYDVYYSIYLYDSQAQIIPIKYISSSVVRVQRSSSCPTGYYIISNKTFNKSPSFSAINSDNFYSPNNASTFSVNMAVDDDLTTTWMSNNSGINNWFELLSDTSQVCRGISIIPGYSKSSAYWSSYNRLCQFDIYIDGEYYGSSQLRDDWSFSNETYMIYIFDKPVKAKSIKIIFTNVYPGSTYNNLCISDFDIF